MKQAHHSLMSLERALDPFVCQQSYATTVLSKL